ncbi:hypothetical protein Ancab_019220 [Ancistrocladus abbreviatus]
MVDGDCVLFIKVNLARNVGAGFGRGSSDPSPRIQDSIRLDGSVRETRTYKEAVLSSHRTATDGHFADKEAASPESFEVQILNPFKPMSFWKISHGYPAAMWVRSAVGLTQSRDFGGKTPVSYSLDECRGSGNPTSPGFCSGIAEASIHGNVSSLKQPGAAFMKAETSKIRPISSSEKGGLVHCMVNTIQPMNDKDPVNQDPVNRAPAAGANNSGTVHSRLRRAKKQSSEESFQAKRPCSAGWW